MHKGAALKNGILDDIRDIMKATPPGQNMIPALNRIGITLRFDDDQAEVWASRGGVEIMLDSVISAVFAIERGLS
jgi:hypothetical protein